MKQKPLGEGVDLLEKSPPLQVDSYYREKPAKLSSPIKARLEEAAAILLMQERANSLKEYHEQFLEK